MGYLEHYRAEVRTPKALNPKALGRDAVAHPGSANINLVYTEGVTPHSHAVLYNTFGVTLCFTTEPWVRRCAATQGFGVQRLRRKDKGGKLSVI